MCNLQLIIMLKNLFKIITVCNIPDSISIIFNKRLKLILFLIYCFLFFIYFII